MYVHYADADNSPRWQVHREYVFRSYSAQVTLVPSFQARGGFHVAAPRHTYVLYFC